MACNTPRRVICIVISSLYLVSNGQHSQQSFKVNSWFPEANLQLNTNYSIIRDSYGFVWLTTADGLLRFDGAVVKEYHASDHGSTISGRETLGLVEDSLHNIWIGSDSGLHRYDVQADSFQVFPVVNNDSSA